MEENASAVTLSSCTSLPVARPREPNWPAALVTPSKPTDCSNGSGPVATCERTRNVNGRDCAGLRLTRSLRVSGSKRQREMREDGGRRMEDGGLEDGTCSLRVPPA